METRKAVGLVAGAIVIILVLYGIYVRNTREVEPVELYQQALEQQQMSVCPDFAEASLKLADHEFNVAVADTKEERVKGLGACDDLPADAGAYFTYDQPENAAYWMKDMLIPIDLLWIANDKVVGFEENLQPPQNSDQELEIYRSPQVVDAVLEINAGQVEEKEIKVGTEVVLDS